MSKTSILIDVTHINEWEGHLTGIERVEKHIILHYMDHCSDAQFVKWDNNTLGFSIIDKDQIKNKEIRHSESPSKHKKIETIVKSSLKKAKNMSKKRLQELPVLGDNTVLIVLAGMWDKQLYIDSLLRESKAGVRIIHIIYDMIPIVQSGFVVEYLPPIFENYMLSVLPVTSAVYAISEHSGSDLEVTLRQKGLTVPYIDSFVLGDDSVDLRPEYTPSDTFKKPFILSVGTIEVRKNHALLYYTYKAGIEKGYDLPLLVIAGKRGWMTSDIQYLFENDQALKGRVVIVDSPSDELLGWLYNNCLFTVFPSFYEGWGLPVRESIMYGKVVLASNTSSLKEAGGICADYFSPSSPEELLKLIVNYLDSDIIKKRENQIVHKRKIVTWEESTNILAGKIQDFLNN